MLNPSSGKDEGGVEAAILAGAADLLKALGHPLRLRIVCGLLQRPLTQTEIACCLGLPQSSVAQHLAVLRRAGLVDGRRSANQVILGIADPRAEAVLRALCPDGTLARAFARMKPEESH